MTWSQETRNRLPPNIGEGNANKYSRKTLYECFKPLNMLGAIFGAFPHPNFYLSNGPHQFRKTSGIYLYSLTLSIGCVIAIITLYSLLERNNNATSSLLLDHTLTLIFRILVFFTGVTSLLFMHYSCSKISLVYQSLHTLDNEIPYNDNGISKLTKIGYAMALYSIIAKLVALTNEYQENAQVSSWVLRFITILFVDSMKTFPILQGASLCLSSASFFRRINNILRDNDTNDYASIVKVKHAKQTFYERKLEHCRNLHLKVCLFTQQVAESLAPQILVVSASYFVLTCYNFYQFWVLLGSFGFSFFLACRLLSAVINIGTLLVLGWSVDKQNDEFEATANIIHTKDFYSQQDEDVCSSLLFFSVQLMQSKPVFTILGFFSVDRSFILAMVGNLATYLVILVQFRYASPYQQNNSNPSSSIN